jgi:hypothetical protein
MNLPSAIKRLTAISIGATLLLAGTGSMSFAANCILFGTVTDSLGLALEGVSVKVIPNADDTFAVGTDSFGFYSITLSVVEPLPAAMVVSAVGFLPGQRDIVLSAGDLRVDFTLVPTAIPIRGIEVISTIERDRQIRQVGSTDIHTAARQSVIPSNPLSAISIPQLSRIGPSVSSNFRIDGSAPQYYLNGVTLGGDPSHFGMFAHVPLQAIERIGVSAEGTDASHGSPTAIDLETRAPFVRHHSGECQVSLVEGTGAYSWGTEKRFVAATVRRSLIDQLAERLDMGSSRQTIPDPTFQDLVLSTGFMLSNQVQLQATGYYAWDRLTYQIGTWRGPWSEEDVWSYQQATERYLGITLTNSRGPVTTTAALGVRDSDRQYRAYLEHFVSPNELQVDLQESALWMTSQLGLRVTLKTMAIGIGWQLQTYDHLSTRLHEKQWNLLSPFAHSNSDYCYQSDLDTAFGTYSATIRPLTQAWYGTVDWHAGRVSLQNGARLEYFAGLNRPTTLGTRHSVTVDAGRGVILGGFVGRFYESPLSQPLESYQVPIRAGLAQLIPINTTVLVGNVNIGWVTLDLTRRLIRNIPVLTPDFSQRYIRIGHTYYFNPGWLAMQSIGRIRTTTMTVRIDPGHPLVLNITPSASYAWSRSRKSELGVTRPYDLDSPNRWSVQIDYGGEGGFSAGIHWRHHDGYPYTPYEASWKAQYNPVWYESYTKQENSLRFTDNSAIDIYCAYIAGRLTLFAGMANVTDHANAIISSFHEIVYDAGLLPIFGIRYQF